MGLLSEHEGPGADSGWGHSHARKGFFTDTSICIGCKACEVACKEWNHNPQDGDLEILGSSYDNTGSLGANTWRHVAFIEQDGERIEQARASGRRLVGLGMPSIGPRPGADASVGPGAAAARSGGCGSGTGSAGACGSGCGAAGGAEAGGGCGGDCGGGGRAGADGELGTGDRTPPDTPEFRWLMSSDVCKHCTHAGCLDVCPTGALMRTEFGTVVVQADICNGCGTCVGGCPFGVIERRDDGTVSPKGDRGRVEQDVPNHGTANKCTLCYDRLVDGQTPACAQTCPTTSIKFGDRADMVEDAQSRVRELHDRGMTEARLYGANGNDGVGGTGSVFLLLDEPEVYGLPPDPQVPTAQLPAMFRTAGIAAAGMIAATALAFLGGRR